MWHSSGIFVLMFNGDGERNFEDTLRFFLWKRHTEKKTFKRQYEALGNNFARARMKTFYRSISKIRKALKEKPKIKTKGFRNFECHPIGEKHIFLVFPSVRPYLRLSKWTCWVRLKWWCNRSGIVKRLLCSNGAGWTWWDNMWPASRAARCWTMKLWRHRL